MGRGGLLALTDQGGGGGIRLPAAAAAAGAGLAVQHQQAVAHLAAGAAQSGDDLAVHDDAAAHAGAQGDEHHVAAAHGGTRHRLRQRGAVGIVAEAGGQAEVLRQHTAHRHIEPAQVIGADHHAPLGVAGTRGAHTDGGAVPGRQARLVQCQLHGAAHVRHHLLRRTAGSGGDAGLRDQVIAAVHHAHGDVGPAQINADAIHKDTPFHV